MVSFDPAAAWRLSPSVALRREPFGALAYDFGTRRLSFLKAPGLVKVVELLDATSSAAAAVELVGVPEVERERHLASLAALARSGMITRRPHENPDEDAS
jgi:putative mycofactocin binding protein MftB